MVNLVYAAFDTFGTIYALTHGGPGRATETLVVKVYEDGYIGNDIGGVGRAVGGADGAGHRARHRCSSALLGRRGRMKRKPDYLAHAVLLLGVVLFALPVWLMFAGATQDAGAIARGELSLIPNLHGFGIFRQALFFGGASRAGYPVWHMLLVSFGMALAIAVGKIVISLLSAYAVVFFRFPFRKIAFWTIFLTLMLPVEVRIIPTYAVIAGFGLINTFAGLTLPLIASATATLLFRQVFTAIPDELVEAARMDGAGPLRFLRDIVLPVSGANIAALFVILFVYGWNQYLWPLLVATSPAYTTVVLGIVKMIAPDQMTHWNLVMATTTLALLPPVVVVVALQRRFRARADGGREIDGDTANCKACARAFRRDRGAAGDRSQPRLRRDAGHRRRLRLRQIDAAAPGRRAGNAERRADPAGRRGHHRNATRRSATSPWCSRTTRCIRI